MMWIITNVIALAFAGAFIAGLRWGLGVNLTQACVIYLLMWVVLSDARIIRKYYEVSLSERTQ